MDKDTQHRLEDWFFVGLALVAIICAALLAWDYFRHPDPIPVAKPTPVASAPVHTEVLAPPAPEVENTPQEQKPIQAKTVTVYAPATKKQLHLPDPVQQDDAEQVISSTTAAPDDHPVTTTTVLNLETGQSTTYQMQEPLPWFQAEHHGEAAITVGYQAMQPTARLEVTEDLAQIKAIHLAITAAADVPLAGSYAPRDFMVGAKIYTRW